MPSSPIYLVCHHCDAVYSRCSLAPGQILRCTRCGAQVARHRSLDARRVLALTVAALIVFVIANVYPIVTISAKGNTSSSTLWSAVIATYYDGKWGVAVMAAATIFFAPLIELVTLFYVLLPLQWGQRARDLQVAMAVLRRLRPWGMIDVFVLGTLVAVVKIGGLATVVPGIGLLSFGALTVLITALGSLDSHDLWDMIDEVAVR